MQPGEGGDTPPGVVGQVQQLQHRGEAGQDPRGDRHQPVVGEVQLSQSGECGEGETDLIIATFHKQFVGTRKLLLVWKVLVFCIERIAKQLSIVECILREVVVTHVDDLQLPEDCDDAVYTLQPVVGHVQLCQVPAGEKTILRHYIQCLEMTRI